MLLSFSYQLNKLSIEALLMMVRLPSFAAGNHTNLREKEFLSILEVATLLGASRWTIQRMVKSNRLPVAKLGSRTIIKRASIDNLFN
jgi:excisionase family DNA binding protein